MAPDFRCFIGPHGDEYSRAASGLDIHVGDDGVIHYCDPDDSDEGSVGEAGPGGHEADDEADDTDIVEHSGRFNSHIGLSTASLEGHGTWQWQS